MMKWVNWIGNEIFDALVITILVSISFILVLPLVPMVIGVQGYYATPHHERHLRLVFRTLVQNRRMITLYTLFTLGILGITTLNIAYFSPLLTNGHGLFVGLNWVIVGVVAISFVYAPMVLLTMHVTLGQLLFNAWIAALTQPLLFVLLAACYAVIGWLIGSLPAFAPLAIAPVLALVAKVTHDHLMTLNHASPSIASRFKKGN